MGPVNHHDELKEIAVVSAHAERVFSAREVTGAINKMAAQMNASLKSKNPIFLCAMVGGIVPVGLLLPRLRFPLQLDYIHASRYRGTTSGGTIQWLQRPMQPLKDRTVVIVDDVLDEGHTLAEIIQLCVREGASEVLSAVLVRKNLPQHVPPIDANFVGLETDNRYLFGFGMDYKNYLRNANGIYAVIP